MKIGSTSHVDFAVSAVRRERMLRARLDGVDYGNPKSVQKARDEITYMGVGDRLVDIGVGAGKREALARLADVLLREKAADWQRGGSDRVLCEEMSKLNRREVQARFLEILSPDQRRAILATPQETEDGIRFSPGLGTELADVLSITFSPEEGKTLLRFDDVGETWQSARTHESDAKKWKEEAETLRTNGSHRLAAKAWAQAAEHFSAAGRSTEAAEAYEQAANALTGDGQRLAASEALGAAAEHWHDAGYHEKSAASRHGQAALLTKLCMHDEAAECSKMERQQRYLHDRSSHASGLPQEILREIASRLTDSASLQAFALVNANWNSAVAPWQNDARAAAEFASGQVVDLDLGKLDDALARIKQLPSAHQLMPLLQLVDKSIIDNPSHQGIFAVAVLAKNLKIFRALEHAAADLAPGDQRKLFAKLSACTPSILPRRRESAWRACFDKIDKINAVEPRDMGASVVQLANSFPPGFMKVDTPEYDGLLSMIAKMKDGDPHKKQAQTAFARGLYSNQGQRYFSEEDAFNELF